MRRGITPKASDVIDMAAVWRVFGQDWQPGESKRIVPVVYRLFGACDMTCKVKVERAADGTSWLFCPICGEHCTAMRPTRRGLGCLDCHEWLGGPHDG